MPEYRVTRRIQRKEVDYVVANSLEEAETLTPGWDDEDLDQNEFVIDFEIEEMKDRTEFEVKEKDA